MEECNVHGATGKYREVSLLMTREKFPSLKAESGMEMRPLLKPL